MNEKPASGSRPEDFVCTMPWVGSASFWYPEYLERSAWIDHAPFAFWLTGTLQPRSFVELGIHHGYSYFAFCQAVRTLGLETRCHAVDTWKGDEHAGFYGEEVFERVRAYNDARYAAFSRLIRSTFDEALFFFADASIDLLHIDGRHFYEDVKHDFESWRPKLSDRAIVLFHDINVREHDFGVFRLWDELKSEFPSFEFLHGHGLGVLGYGSNLPAGIASFFEAASELAVATEIRAAYGRLGTALKADFDSGETRTRLNARLKKHEATATEITAKLEARQTEANELAARLKKQEARASELAAQVQTRERELERIKNSSSWRVTAPLRVVAARLRWIETSIRHTRRGVLDWLKLLRRILSAPDHPEAVSQLVRPGVPEYGPIERILSYDSKQPAPLALNETICVHLHLFYTEMADEFAKALARLSQPHTLLISIPQDQDSKKWDAYFRQRLPCAQELVVRAVPNRGRDVLPWLVTFAELIQRHEIFCHMHSKRSPHQEALKDWGKFLIHTTFGSPSIVNQILKMFAEDSNLGLVFPPYKGWLRRQPNWGKCQMICGKLYSRMTGGKIPEECPDYPAGSFFWARVSTLQPLFELKLSNEDFADENAQVDGTLAHGIERMIGALPGISQTRKMCVTVDTAHNLVSAWRITEPLRRIGSASRELFKMMSVLTSARRGNPKRKIS